MLYGELARFVFRLMGIKTKPKKGGVQYVGAQLLEEQGQQFADAPKANNNSWDSVWTQEGKGK
jgi:peroxin-13